MEKRIVAEKPSMLVFPGSCELEEDEIRQDYAVPQGIIGLDSEFAKKIGFVSNRFLSCSYLFGDGNCILIRTIECTQRRRGNLRELFKAIWGLGAHIAVLTPLSTMENILMHYGFKKTIIQDPFYGKTDLWIK